MKIIIEKYSNNTNETAYIEQEKHSNLFRVEILKPYNDGTQNAELLFKKEYTGKPAAKRAIMRYSNNFKREN